MLGLFDVILLLVIALSSHLGLRRGFAREVVATVVLWPIVAITSLYLVLGQPVLSLRVAHWLGLPVNIAEFIAVAGLFLVVLVAIYFVLLSVGRNDSLNIVDRILGAGFGVIRGFVLVVIAYMWLVSVVCSSGTRGCEPGQLPLWVESSRSLGMITATGRVLFNVLHRFVPPGVSSG